MLKKETIVVIDGFPRNQDNIDGWKEICGDSVNVLCTVNLECDEATCVARLSKRSETSDRADDDAEVIKTRFNNHVKQSLPILDQLGEMAELVTVNTCKAPEEVFKEVLTRIEAIIKA